MIMIMIMIRIIVFDVCVDMRHAPVSVVLRQRNINYMFYQHVGNQECCCLCSQHLNIYIGSQKLHCLDIDPSLISCSVSDWF